MKQLQCQRTAAAFIQQLHTASACWPPFLAHRPFPPQPTLTVGDAIAWARAAALCSIGCTRGILSAHPLACYHTLALTVTHALQEHWRHVHCSGSNPAAVQTSSNVFVGCLGALQHLFSGVCHTVAAQLSLSPDSMLPGSDLLAAAHLVSEPVMWACLFVTSWQQMFVKKKVGTKSKGNAVSNAMAGTDSNDDVVRQQLDRAQQAYVAGLQQVLTAVNVCLKSSTKSQLADATQMTLGTPKSAQSSLTQTINGCLSAADVRACLTAIVENQKLLLKRIKLQLSELISAL